MFNQLLDRALVINKTSDYSIVPSIDGVNAVFTNTGATSGIVLTLPLSSHFAGFRYTFVCSGVFPLIVIGRPGDNIYGESGTQITCPPKGEITLICLETQKWVIEHQNGCLELPRREVVYTDIASNDARTAGAFEKGTGQYFTWGWHNYGELGDGSGTSKSTPVSVFGTGRFEYVWQGIQVCAGIEKNTGILYAWGFNQSGAFGRGNTSGDSTPVVAFGGKLASKVASGNNFCLMIEKTTGYLWSAGSSSNGESGNFADLVDHSFPVSVVGGKSWSHVCAGGSNAGAIEGSTGYAWCWGFSSGGAIGDGANTNRSSPTSVQGGRSFSKILNSMFSTFIGREASTGFLWGWGQNGNATIGDNSVSNKSSPVSVVGGRSFSDFAPGYYHTLAIEGSTGYMWAWGESTFGQVGSNIETAPYVYISSPVSVVGGRSWSKVAAGQTFSLAIEANSGIIYGWGKQYDGWDSEANRSFSSPVSVKSGLKARFLVCTGNHDGGFAELGSSNVYFWGPNGTYYGINTSVRDRAYPDKSVAGGRSFSKIVCMNTWVASIEASTGFAWSWGNNSLGQLGNNNNIGTSSPVSVVGGRSFKDIATTSTATVGIDGATGYAWSWGSNNVGQLGTNSNINASSPVSVVGGRSFQSVVGCGSADVMCALDGNFRAWSWGSNSYGACGDNTTNPRSSPVSVVGGRLFSKIFGFGWGGFAGIDTLGYAWIWGNNNNYQLGDSSVSNKSSPVSVVGDRKFSYMVGSVYATLALEASTGYAWAWGYGAYGQLGNNSSASASSPVSVYGGRSYTQIACWGQGCAALDPYGVIWVWGTSSNNSLLQGSVSYASSPVSIARHRFYTPGQVPKISF
jgi:alpha-tubulin suppressor-like RCC1 family protein